jgi:hypothetical protein
MMRISHFVLMLPLILGAAPTHPTHPTNPTHPGPLPVPPIPPAHPPTDGPAPTPDQYATAPSVPQPEGPRITPRILRVPSFNSSLDPSQGFGSGSRWQDDSSADRRLMPSPGFNFLIPFK